MKPLDTFTPRSAKEEAAVMLSNQICFEGGELLKQGLYQDALDAYRQDLQLCGETCGNDHSYFANSLWDMGVCYCRLDQSDFAMALFSRAFDIHERACGADHWLTVRDIDGMAHCLTQAGQYERALILRQRQLGLVVDACGAENSLVARVFGEIAYLYDKSEQPEKAVPFWLRKLAVEENLYGVESASVIDTVAACAESYEQLKQYERALPLRQRVQAHYETQGDGMGSQDIAAAMRPVAACLGKLGRRDLAISILQRAVDMSREIYERENLLTSKLFLALSETYEEVEDSGRASKVREWGIRIGWNIIGTDGEELHKGAIDGDIDRLRRALKNGAEVDAKDKYGRTALIEAATHGQKEAAEILIELGAGVSCADQRGRTPLSSAISYGRMEVFELLLQHGADTTAPGEDGRSLLMEGCINNVPMHLRLLELNPDLEQRDRYGKTALILAAEWGSLKFVEALIERGAKIDATDDAGLSALMRAARGKATQPEADYLAIVGRLLAAGADPAQSGWNDKTALDYAREGDEIMGQRVVQEGMVKLLESFMSEGQLNA